MLDCRQKNIFMLTFLRKKMRKFEKSPDRPVKKVLSTGRSTGPVTTLYQRPKILNVIVRHVKRFLLKEFRIVRLRKTTSMILSNDKSQD